IGSPALRAATNCTSQRSANSVAPVRPISFHGLTCSPVQASAASSWFITSICPSFVEFGGAHPSGVAAADQPEHAHQVLHASDGAREVVVLRCAGPARPVADGNAARAPAGALHQGGQ